MEEMFIKRDWIEWLKCAGIRAIKTFAQSCAATIAISVPLNEINWVNTLLVGGTAALLSLLTSLAGIPEVKENDYIDE